MKYDRESDDVWYDTFFLSDLNFFFFYENIDDVVFLSQICIFVTFYRRVSSSLIYFWSYLRVNRWRRITSLLLGSLSSSRTDTSTSERTFRVQYLFPVTDEISRDDHLLSDFSFWRSILDHMFSKWCRHSFEVDFNLERSLILLFVADLSPTLLCYNRSVVFIWLAVDRDVG